MQGVFLAIFTLVFSGATLMFDGLIVHTVFKQYQSTSWTQVNGMVTDSRVLTHHSSKGGSSYSAAISYKYQVNGQAFSNNRLRYSGINTGNYAAAQNMVNTHQVGSVMSVFYDPADPADSILFPGIKGEDMLVFLFLMPFNSFSIGGWVLIYRWARERLKRPIAGGVKIITDGLATRVRLPRIAASFWGVVTTNIVSLAALIIIAVGTQSHPSISLALAGIGGSLLAGLAVYFWRCSVIQSGIDDLVINEASHQLELPLTFGRKARLTIDLTEINEVYTEIVEHRSNKGGISYTYAPTLFVRGEKGGPQKLADWSDKLKADDFTTWLRQKLGMANRN